VDFQHQKDGAMYGFSNVSTDSDQAIAPARLYQGHWRHQLHPHGEVEMCRVVIDTAEPRVVAAQVIEHGFARDLGATALEDLNTRLLGLEVHHHPAAWGLSACSTIPAWATPTFSAPQIDELQRLEGYLDDASEDSFDSVLQLRDDFLLAIGMTPLDACRALREAKQSQGPRKSGRYLMN
jgi:hypothetical protein